MKKDDEKVLVTPDTATRIKRVRYAYVVLALISVICAVIAVEVALKAIRNNNHNFCDLMNGLTVIPAIKPVDPVQDSKAERAWQIYETLVKLDHRLGC